MLLPYAFVVNSTENALSFTPMQRLPWIERKFQLDVPAGWLHNIIARLSGTESRLRHITHGRPDAVLESKANGKWSIKEHIGHLDDLERLHLQRIGDFENHREELSLWDVTNSATENANHNEEDVQNLIASFAIKRNELIERLRNLDDETHRFRSTHPRLHIPMKPVDMASFVAEHDDHHIATMLSILQTRHGYEDT